MKITYLGIVKDQFKYSVELNGHLFDFHTGLGWNAQGKNNPDPKLYATLTFDEQDIVLKKGTPSFSRRTRDKGEFFRIYRRKPTESDVLECLQSDCEAGRMSFTEFCDTFGYSDDSLSALDMYRACMSTANKLRGYKFPEKSDA